MHASMDAVLHYLQKVDPAAARRARERYSCFEHFGKQPEAYAYATARGRDESCEREVVEQLIELQRNQHALLQRDGKIAAEEFFSAEQNARLVRNAEQYYRSMFRGRDESWNLRDTHMFETLQGLMGHLDGGQARLVVWAHNSHLGDASATEMNERNELNVGQLVRERYRREAMLIGFSTYAGTVTAASEWGGDAELKRVKPGMQGSYEDLFHRVGMPRFWLDLRHSSELVRCLREPRLQRAIGVIYQPATERWSHYFHADLPRQFDAMIHLDETHALQPLERSSLWDPGELPETYPFNV
jgi:erythromycin esterase-like protein